MNMGMGKGVTRPASAGLGGGSALKKPRTDAGDEGCIGELRFETAEAVQQALQLNGTEYMGSIITIEQDAKSKDGTKIWVSGLAPGTQWQKLKDHFSCCGTVCFANVKKNAPLFGTVRFSSAQEAQQALGLNGTILGGYQIEVKVHPGSKDGTKIQMLNLPPCTQWQELKDHFTTAGLAPMFVDCGSGGECLTAEVRYDDASHAQQAAQLLNGSLIAGGPIEVQLDANSKDGTKLLISGIPAGVQWQEVKDHFAQCGPVGFAAVNDPNQKGGKGGGNAAMGMMAMMGGGQMLPNGMMMMPNGVIVSAGMMGGMMGGGMMGGGMMGGGMMGGMMGGMGKMGGGKGFGPRTGEVRFENPMHAQFAVAMLNGSMLGSSKITVTLDTQSKDMSKVWVSNLDPQVNWQAMKDHFKQAGEVAFAQVS